MWDALAQGERFPLPDILVYTFGIWHLRWQYHASYNLEATTHADLLRDRAPPGGRSNVAIPGKAQIHSFMGPFAATWLLVSPTSALLRIRNAELQCAMRRLLGIAVLFDSPNPHGHARLADGTGDRTHAMHIELITA